MKVSKSYMKLNTKIQIREIILNNIESNDLKYKIIQLNKEINMIKFHIEKMSHLESKF